MQSSKLPEETAGQSTNNHLTTYERLLMEFKNEVNEKSRKYDHCKGDVTEKPSGNKHFKIDSETLFTSYSTFAQNFPRLHGLFFPRPFKYSHSFEFNTFTQKTLI